MTIPATTPPRRTRPQLILFIVPPLCELEHREWKIDAKLGRNDSEVKKIAAAHAARKSSIANLPGVHTRPRRSQKLARDRLPGRIGNMGHLRIWSAGRPDCGVRRAQDGHRSNTGAFA